MKRAVHFVGPVALVACAASSPAVPAEEGLNAEAGRETTTSVPDAAEPSNTKEGATAVASESGADVAMDVAPGIDAGSVMSDASAGCAGLFCEDFEQGQIDPAKWDLQVGAGGTAMIQQQTVAHGKHAMQVHGLAGPSDYALIVTKNAPAALQGPNFGRAYFFTTPKPLTSGHTEMVFAGTIGTGPANGPGPFPKLRYMEVANINGGWQIGFDLLDVAPLIEEVFYPAGSPQVPTATWTCLEWQFSDAPDVINMWIDDKAIGTFDDNHVSYPAGHVPGSPLYNGKSSGLIGRFTEFGFGFHDWHPNKPFDLYYDDIVLDTKRVGCLK